MAIAPFATQKLLKVNFNAKGMKGHKGVVLHIMDGTLDGTNSWFNNPHSEASSHFGNGKDGRLFQWVDTDNKAWTEASGNPLWISIENEGKGGDALTPKQIANCAKIYEWAEKLYHFGFAITSNVNQNGLGHHSMGGQDWGGHLNCPGTKIIAQKPLIIARAKAIRGIK